MSANHVSRKEHRPRGTSPLKSKVNLSQPPPTSPPTPPLRSLPLPSYPTRHGKKKCDLRDPGSIPCSKHILAAQLKIGLAQHTPTCIEYQFIIALNGNFVNCVLNGSSSIVQLQFSLEIHQTYGIMQVVLHEL